MQLKTAFKPIVDEKSKILILGTMPGERSLKLQQYYGHGRNQFWKILFELFEEPFTKDYSKRTQLLLQKRIAVWDVLSHCEGKGSSDTAIKNEIPNDFTTFYNTYPDISRIFLTSQKAESFYNKYIGKQSIRTYYLLPSPSSANTWKTYNEKVNDWKIILKG